MDMKTKLTDLLRATEQRPYRELIQNLLASFAFEEIKNYATIEVTDTKDTMSEATNAGIEFVTGVLAKVTAEQDAADKIFGMTCTQVWNFMAKMAADKIAALDDPQNPDAGTVVERIFWRHTLQWAMAASVSHKTCGKIGITGPGKVATD